jgi:hypothetical protein
MSTLEVRPSFSAPDPESEFREGFDWKNIPLTKEVFLGILK